MKTTILFFAVCYIAVSASAAPKTRARSASVIPATTMRTIEGKYELGGSGNWYAGSSIELRDGRFSHEVFTDVVGDPRLKDNPQRGSYTLDGCILTLHFPKGHESHLIIVYRKGRFTMWSGEEYAEYLRTGTVSHFVLYQQTPR